MTIIVPCFNEADRLPVKKFHSFLEHNEADILFVNDASTDNTLEVLMGLKKSFENQVTIISNQTNSGKAASIRNGVLNLIPNDNVRLLAYLDADLATSLEECFSYQSYIDEGKQFVFASRILKIGSVVERRFSRFLVGRIIATFISSILDIKVYDTQCGCKLFTKAVAQTAFKEPFISKWLFDVELFSRLIKTHGKEKALAMMEEVPVKRWVDQGESKVKLSYFFKLWFDLYRIWKSHKL